MSTANINRPSAATRRTSGNSPARQGVARMIAAAAVTGIAAGLSPTWAPTASAAGEVADPERTSQVVTEWGAHRNVSPATVNTLLSKGYRIADI